ncbi:MAG: M20/M25/M40 family metallo-hydrolase [Pyrinomonadaceae bacterium]
MRQIKILLPLIFVCAVLLFSLFFQNVFTRPTKAENPEFWISVDSGELKQVVDFAARNGDQIKLETVAVKNGISIVGASDSQMQKVSSYMHRLRNKCSGFIAHQSKEEALETVDRLFNANTRESLVNYTIDNQSNVNQMLPAVLETNVRQTITDLSAFPNRRYNQPSGTTSAEFIKNEWTALALGRSDISVEYFTHPSTVSPQPSVILTVQGTNAPEEVVVLGAHQDSINTSGQTQPAPGADDDASGVASLTEAIRVLIEKNFHPQKTVKFMAYAAEEVGLRGSKEIALDYRTRNVNVVGVLQLDMTNFKGSTQFDFALVSDFTNAAQNTFVADLIGEYLPNLTVTTTLCNYGCSDHASWTAQNYPSSFPFEATFGQHNHSIHSANDTLSQSGNSADHALKFSKLALAFVGELAKGSIEQNNSNPVRADFDGDGKTDISVFRPETGVWYLNQSSNGFLAITWGISTDKPIPADYDGDGTTDIAIFRGNSDPNLPDIYILRTGDFTFSGASWGVDGDIPTIADYDGDGKADISIYRPAANTWYILNSSDGSVFTHTFGETGDRPIVGDFDGDGKADLNLLRNENQWLTLKSSDNYSTVEEKVFGLSGDVPVPADFDGDGIDNIAVFRPQNGTWYYLRTDDNISFVQFGSDQDVPVTGDYDGDGISDYAVFRPSNGVWYILRSSNASFQIEGFGLETDKPLPFAYQPGS